MSAQPRPYYLKSNWTGRTPRTMYEAFGVEWKRPEHRREYLKDGACLAIGVLALGAPALLAWAVHLWG